MSGRPRSSPIHRDKKTICQDLEIILGQACYALSIGAKYAVIDQALNLWSSHEGKYSGCQYWTPEAILAAHEHLRYEGQGLAPPYEHRIVHEHIIPRNIIRDILLNSQSLIASEIESLLKLYCVGAIITKPQDDKLTKAKLRASMPNQWQPGDIWARYRICELKIVDRHNNDELVQL